ncbi:MAG: hypothetical protein FWD26_04995 [Treponema sp.]|nr:hypothetical protein [Treponema sp.]
MVNDIINRLREGSIPNVVLYADDMQAPLTPYAVVKPESEKDREKDSETVRIRVKAFAEHGSFELLEQYITNELTRLLKRKLINGYMERGRNEWSGIEEDKENQTISMERVFEYPRRLI